MTVLVVPVPPASPSPVGRARGDRAGRTAQLHVDFRRSPVTVLLSGDVDGSTAEVLAALLDGLLESAPDRVVVDVDALTSIDTAGAAPLLDAAVRAAACGALLEFRGSSTALSRLLAAAPVSTWPAAWLAAPGVARRALPSRAAAPSGSV